MKNADLHTHSYYSDGALSPTKLVQLAKKRGLKSMALTDHNSVKGVQEAIREGKRIGVNVIPAVELRCRDAEILAYFIDIKNKALIKKLETECRKIESRVKDWCNKLNKAGYDITYEEITEKYTKSEGNHNEGHPLVMLYKKGKWKGTLELAQELGEKNIRAKKAREMSVVTAIKLIRKAGGVPVFAHIWIDETKRHFRNIKKYVKAGLRGIEINNGDRYPYKPKGINKEIRDVAKRFNLIITSGSDYHSELGVKLMPGNHDLGQNNCDENVIEELRELAL